MSPITSSAKDGKSNFASLIDSSYFSLSHISIILITDDITVFLDMPAWFNKSLGISNLPDESISISFTPAVNLLIKSRG